MLTNRKLLIVEEVALIALDIQRVVEDANAQQTMFARDFAEAEGFAERFGEFDLAIVNPPDPGTPGIEVATQLATAGPAIVVCTAAGLDLSSTPFAGAEVITKPFADSDLFAACQRALDRRGR